MASAYELRQTSIIGVMFYVLADKYCLINKLILSDNACENTGLYMLGRLCFLYNIPINLL